MISREEAIRILDPSTTMEALAEIEYHAGFNGKRAVIEAVNEARMMGAEALGLLNPKKPHLWGDGYADGHLVYDMWNCPNCEITYEVDYDEYDHCPACGQAIDWRDSE